MSHFSDLEGLRLAMEIEAQGYEFYRKAHDSSTNPQHQLLFSFLMQEELNHTEKFKHIYESLKHKDTSEDEYLFDPEASRYLRVLVETRIFPSTAIFSNEHELANGILQTGWTYQTPGHSSSVLTTEAILMFALQAEKDAILFFDEMMTNAKFPEAKKVFAELKAEEQAHVTKLQDLIVNLKK